MNKNTEKKALNLNFIWSIRLKLCAEGNTLRAEGNKLCAEGDKLCAEGDKLWAEGDKLWAEAIIEVYGNVKIEWRNYDVKKNDWEFHVEGEVFKP